MSVFPSKEEVKRRWDEAIGSLRPTVNAFVNEFNRLVEERNRLGTGPGAIEATPPNREYKRICWTPTVGGHRLAVEFYPKSGHGWIDYGPMNGFVAKLSGAYGVRGQTYRAGEPAKFNVGRMAVKLLGIVEETKRQAERHRAEVEDGKYKRGVIDRLEFCYPVESFPIPYRVHSGRSDGKVSITLDDLTEAQAKTVLSIIDCAWHKTPAVN